MWYRDTVCARTGALRINKDLPCESEAAGENVVTRSLEVDDFHVYVP